MKKEHKGAHFFVMGRYERFDDGWETRGAGVQYHLTICKFAYYATPACTEVFKNTACYS